MKKTIFTLLLSLLLQVSFSQGTTLTKGETVDYILNKLQEVKEAKMANTEDDENIRKHNEYTSKYNLSLTGNKITYSIVSTNQKLQQSRNDLSVVTTDYLFNPGNIASIEISETTLQKGVSAMEILFHGEVVRITRTYNDGIVKKWMMSSVLFYFDNTEPQNFNRLKNAFLHLKDLITAEGDPFDN